MDLPGPTGRVGSVEQRPVLLLSTQAASTPPLSRPCHWPIPSGWGRGWVSSPGAAQWGRSKSSVSRLKNKVHPIPAALPLCSEVRPPAGF